MLNFDFYQRSETVKHLINWALPEKGSILDVGGYPGRMRSLLPNHHWVLCDPLVDAAGNQVKGSGDALPFQNDSFDYAISLDVFEHIPENKRLSVLNEMKRVAKQGIILSFPHNDSLVTEAEQHVRNVYQEIHHKEHPWLSEHANQPLPDIEKITSHLNNLGGDHVVFDVGSLRRWTQLQLLSVILETIPNSLDFAKQIDEFYQEHVFIHEFEAPAYRKILIHQFAATEPIELSLVETTPQEKTQAEVNFQHLIMHGLYQLQSTNKKRLVELEKQNQLLQTSKDKQQEQPDKPETITSTDGQDEYISRLEKGIQLWEETYNQTLQNINEAYTWRDNLEQRRSFKIYKRFMRLLGQKISP